MHLLIGEENDIMRISFLKKEDIQGNPVSICDSVIGKLLSIEE